MGVRILVIEDNADNLELVCYLLRAFGHQAIAARDGLSGVRMAAEENPDIVLCDIQLPDIDGYEVARRIRTHPLLASIPMVAVTASAQSSDRQRVLDCGFDGYFSKPIDPETFVSDIDGFLPPAVRSRRPSHSA